MSVKPEEIVTEGFTLSKEQREWLARQVNDLAAKGEGSAKYEDTPTPATVFNGTDPDGNAVTIHDVEESAVSVVTEDSPESTEEASTEEVEEEHIQPCVDPTVEETIKEMGASDEVSYVDYPINDVEKYLDSIDTLGFIELISLKKQAEGTISQIEEAKGVMEAIDNMPNLEDGISKDVMKNNFFNGFEMAKSKAEFEQTYPQMEESLKKVVEKVNGRLEKEFLNTNSTKFLTEEMVSLLKKKLEKLLADREENPTDPKYLNIETTIRQLDSEIYAFSHRLDVPQRLYSEAIKFLTTKKPLKNALDRIREFAGNPNVEKLTPAIRKVYSSNQIRAVFDYMKTQIFDDDIAARLFLCFLDYALDRSRKNDLGGAVKVFILNICDIHTGIFDLCDQDAYTDNIDECYGTLFSEYAEEI